MNAKGQGAIEYLLLIGGAVIVVGIIIALMANVPNSAPAPECSVECGNLAFMTISEAACNNHVMENPNQCDGHCILRQNQCQFEPCQGAECTAAPSTCPSGLCLAGENCPADSGSCTDNTCFEPTCTNGCGETAVAARANDEACIAPLMCNGTGTCVECIASTDCPTGENCVAGTCEAATPTCPDGTCGTGEDCTICEADCGLCGPIEAVSASNVIPIHTGDGTILYNGYIYITTRLGGPVTQGWVAKVNASDYTFSLSGDIAPSDFIVLANGLLWTSDMDNGYVFSLNLATLEATYRTNFFFFGAIPALATDGSYLFAGGDNGNFGSYNIATGVKEERQYAIQPPGGSTYFHSLCADESFVYGISNNSDSTSTLVKINKDTLELVASTEVPITFHDDVIQDNQYFYLNGSNLIKVSKADLSYTSAFETPLADSIDGMDFADGYILGAVSDGATDLEMIVFNKESFTESHRVTLTGFNAITAGGFKGYSNEVIVDGDYVHVTRYSKGGGITITKFNLADILGS